MTGGRKQWSQNSCQASQAAIHPLPIFVPLHWIISAGEEYHTVVSLKSGSLGTVGVDGSLLSPEPSLSIRGSCQKCTSSLFQTSYLLCNLIIQFWTKNFPHNLDGMFNSSFVHCSTQFVDDRSQLFLVSSVKWRSLIDCQGL